MVRHVSQLFMYLPVSLPAPDADEKLLHRTPQYQHQPCESATTLVEEKTGTERVRTVLHLPHRHIGIKSAFGGVSARQQ